jgi:hypothetical protein
MTRGRGAPSPVPRSSRGSPRLKPILGGMTGGGEGRSTPPNSVTAAAVARGGGEGGGGGGKMLSENSPSPKPRGKETPPSRRSYLFLRYHCLVDFGWLILVDCLIA